MTEKQRKYLIELLPLAIICALMALFILGSAVSYTHLTLPTKA